VIVLKHGIPERAGSCLLHPARVGQERGERMAPVTSGMAAAVRESSRKGRGRGAMAPNVLARPQL